MLIDPVCRNLYPTIPVRSGIFDTCAYWETLYYLFTAILGWQQLDKGLAWWYEKEKDDMGDICLSLVRDIWDYENQLDYFAAWTWKPGCNFSPEDFSSDRSVQQNSQNNKEWWQKFKRKGRLYPHDPFHGGTNPLHLGHSECFGFDQVDHDKSILNIDRAKHRAILVVNQLGSWRMDLQTAGTKLPPLGEHSWRLEIFDRQAGYLGMYRQSRETGRWFMGKHNIHMRGN